MPVKHGLIAMMLLLVLLPLQLRAQPVIEVEIDGVDNEIESNILLFLSIEQQKTHPLMSDGRIRRLHDKADAEIAAALQPYGFYRPQITSSLTEVEDEVWLARYQIDPGPGITIAEFNLDVVGPMLEDPSLQKLIEKTALAPGTVLLHSNYDAFKSRLSGLASERGYMEARFTDTRLEIDLNSYEARIYLGMDSGPRYRFGEVSLTQDVLDDELLQRYIPFRSGDPFNLDQVIALQQALNDSNYFEVVEVSPGAAQRETEEIPIVVKLTPRKRNRYDVGVGYGTDTGFRAKFGWRMPRVNRRGHRIDSEIEVSEIGYNIGANYRIPVLNPRTDQLVYSISREKEDTDTNDSLIDNIGVSLAHGRGDWRETLALNYQLEDFSVADESGNSVLLIPSVAWSRIWSNDFINVLDGLRFDINLRGGSESFVSDTDFVQLRGGLKFIYSFDPRNRLLMRGSFGTTQTSDFDQLPSSIRFFAGGSQSVRGYAYESLGPENADGEVVGGKHLLTGSVEFEHYFDDKWGVAVFIDAGNAIDNWADELEQGAGFGLRWKSPVGPVRVDLANAISTEDKPWRLAISIGPDL
jgi:translocation and assembly module TamA